MSVLVVGCGFVGERVARRLVEEGRRVHATTRKPERADALRALGIEPAGFDLVDPSACDPLPTVEAVLVAVGFDRSLGLPMERIYVDGLTHLLARLPDSVRRLVYVSSTSVYGGGDGGRVDESSSTVPETDAGRVVLRAEEVLRDWSRRGASIRILRCSGLYGPGRLINKAAIVEGRPIAVDPDGWLNLVHGDDAAEAALRALVREEAPEVVNVTDDRPILRREYYETAARCLGAPPPRFESGSASKKGRPLANNLLKVSLLPTLLHPDISTGVPATVAAERAPG